MKSKCCSWSMMAIPMMMMGMKAMSAGRRQQNCSQPSQNTACGETEPSLRRTPPQDIVDAAAGAGVFTKLVAAVQAAGLVETLKGKGPFTVFAPTDEAFSKLPSEALEAAMKDTDLLKSILTYHVVPGRYLAADLAGIDALKTVQGSALKVGLQAGVRVGSAQVVKADIAVSNGVIHVIDSVLMPQ